MIMIHFAAEQDCETNTDVLDRFLKKAFDADE